MAHIAVLDDVLDAAVMIKRILEKRGHKVNAFTEEQDLLNLVQKEKVDLVILDIKLKKMTGIDVLGEVKKARPETRAIMLTGYPTLDTAREALRLGASEYCVKPVDKDELESKVDEVLGG
jgi:DNA-binding NtrC family response regulator